jgi:glycosyltransferase involved in cell wall biosynthesis
MKICFVGLDALPVLAREYNQHGIGGEQVQHTLLARALARRGFDVSMLAFDYGQPDGATWDGVRTLRTYRQDAGLPVVRFVYPRWTALRKALRRADADIYYVSCAGAQLGQVVHFAKPRGRRVVFRVAHDRDCDPDALLIKYWRDRQLYRYGLQRSATILVQSLRQQEAMRRNYGLTSSIARMLVDEPRQNLEYSARNVDVLWVNNLRDFKRPDRFLAVARSLPQLGSHMIGGPQPGFEHLFAEISRKAAAVPSLTFHGRVPYHDVNEFYERARVFVNTSDSEGFPNSYLQAWVRGTPVVAFFDPDGIIAREGLGLAVSSDEEMRQASLQLASDPVVWGAASERCRNYMRRNFDTEVILEPYLSAFRGELPRPVA